MIREFSPNSINCSKQKGPLYNSIEILAHPKEKGTFLLFNKKETTSRTLEAAFATIQLNPEEEPAVSIDDYGWTMEDFKYLPLNKFGFKELAVYLDETLVLTNTGLIVLYSGCLPSLKGLPSDLDVVSGFWVDQNGLAHAPYFTLHRRAQLRNFGIACKSASFREFPSDMKALVDAVSVTEFIDHDAAEVGDCMSASPVPLNSRFVSSYPCFTADSLSTYNQYSQSAVVEKDSSGFLATVPFDVKTDEIVYNPQKSSDGFTSRIFTKVR